MAFQRSSKCEIMLHRVVIGILILFHNVVKFGFEQVC